MMPDTATQSPASPRATAPATGPSPADWLDRMRGIGRDHGFFERLGPDHLALFVQEGDTLLVSFDRAPRILAGEPDGLPLGFDAVQRKEWSLLSIIALDKGWFRTPDLMDFFDGLAAAGFFDSFAQVFFLGFGPGEGHAACVYSAAAPGALVLASSPAATIDPERAGFDRRALQERRREIGRYGDAPGLLASARGAVILYDPTDPISGAHAAQFRAPPATLAPLRFTGPAPHEMIRSNGLLLSFLRALGNGRLSRQRVALMMRAVRRSDPDYLWSLAQLARSKGRISRARKIATHAAKTTGAARFTDLIEDLAKPGL